MGLQLTIQHLQAKAGEWDHDTRRIEISE